MKKILSVLLVAALVLPVAAKEKETPEQIAQRDYSTWLPQKGEWSVGFSLDPIATFAGNLFNGKLNNTLDDLAGKPMMVDALGGNMVSIMGSYMLTNNLAAVANIGLKLRHESDNQYVLDDAALFLNPLSREKVVDSYKGSSTFGSIALGVEYRVGKTRPVQGVFGAGVNYIFGTEQYSYSYGNGITEANQTPSIADGTLYEAVAGYMPNARPLSSQATDLIHGVGLYGSVGIEWFVAPKIALGANVNIALYYMINPSRTTIYEGWNTMSIQKETFTETIAPASHGVSFGTENIGANLYISFYFGNK